MVWIIPAFMLPFLVVGISASGYFWPIPVLAYSAMVIGLGYCDTHLPDSHRAPIRNASPGRRLQFAMGFFGIQIFVAPITLILISGLIYIGITLVSKIGGLGLP